MDLRTRRIIVNFIILFVLSLLQFTLTLDTLTLIGVLQLFIVFLLAVAVYEDGKAIEELKKKTTFV